MFNKLDFNSIISFIVCMFGTYTILDVIYRKKAMLVSEDGKKSNQALIILNFFNI